MRNLFLLLVLLNLGVLAWFGWVHPEPERPAVHEGPGLRLLRELDADDPIVVASRRQAAPASPVSELPLEDPALAALSPSDPGGFLSSGFGELPAAVDSADSADSVAFNDPDGAGDPADPAASGTSGTFPTSCVAVGPFTESDQADAAVATLNAEGFTASLSIEQQEVWEGFWVYVAGLPTLERANAALAELAASGIADAYVIPNSDRGILISLGVFSDVTRAGAQAERAGRFGLAATITERIRTEEVRWIELQYEGGASPDLSLLQQPGRISRLEQRDCGTPGGI